MASKRSTNNSTIVNLEEQTAVIDQVLEQVGVRRTPLSTEVSGDRGKQISKKKKKSGQTTLSSGDVTSNDDVTKEAPGRAAVPKRSQPTRPSAALGGPVNQDAQPGDQPSNAVHGDDVLSNGVTGAGRKGNHAPSAQPGDAQSLSEDLAQYLAQQQQQSWMWQQQAFPMNYGNFVPNYPLGGGFLPTSWDQEDQAPVGMVRQGTHEISDDEEDEDPPSTEPAEPAGVQGAKGKTADLVKEQLGQVKDSDRVLDPVDPEVAKLLDRFLLESTTGGDMDKLAKQYPRVENVERMKVPRLDEEIFQVVDQKHKSADQSLQGVQRALMGSMAALSAVLELSLARGTEDPELDGLGRNILDSLQLQSFAHNALLTKRKELLKPELAPVYARELARGQSSSPDWLFGGDLVETTRKCDAAKKIGEKIGKRKGHNGPRMPQKRFRAPFPANFNQPQQGTPVLRAFNPYQGQQFRFPAPQMFQPAMQFQQFQPTQFGGFPRRGKNPRYQNQKQGFGKRGGYKQ